MNKDFASLKLSKDVRKCISQIKIYIGAVSMEHQDAGLPRPSVVTCDPDCLSQLAVLVEVDSHNVHTAAFITFFSFTVSLAHPNTNCSRSQGAIFNGIPWVDAISCCLCVDFFVH